MLAEWTWKNQVLICMLKHSVCLCLSISFSQAHTHLCIHTHTHLHIHTLSLSHTHSLSLFYTHTDTQTDTHTLSLSSTHTKKDRRTHTLSLSFTYTHKQASKWPNLKTYETSNVKSNFFNQSQSLSKALLLFIFRRSNCYLHSNVANRIQVYLVFYGFLSNTKLDMTNHTFYLFNVILGN